MKGIFFRVTCFIPVLKRLSVLIVLHFSLRKYPYFGFACNIMQYHKLNIRHVPSYTESCSSLQWYTRTKIFDEFNNSQLTILCNKHQKTEKKEILSFNEIKAGEFLFLFRFLTSSFVYSKLFNGQCLHKVLGILNHCKELI